MFRCGVYMFMLSLLQNPFAPLPAASQQGHIDVVERLLQAGARVNAQAKVQIDCLALL